METVVRHLAVMWTAFVLTVSAPTRDRALDASEEAVRAIEAAERLLSTWRADTPIARLNAASPGVAIPVPPELFALLKRVFEWEKTTGGAFDPAVLPLVTAWGLRTGGQIPDATALARAREASRPDLFTFERSSLRVSRRSEAAGIDEGAWGKGWALDRAAETLRAAGATLRFEEASASTSGNSERGLAVNGRRIGHLLDGAARPDGPAHPGPHGRRRAAVDRVDPHRARSRLRARLRRAPPQEAPGRAIRRLITPRSDSSARAPSCPRARRGPSSRRHSRAR
jgi:thiamine biosynthesis lipoprotein ApbE